jgi:hypothetical protein
MDKRILMNFGVSVRKILKYRLELSKRGVVRRQGFEGRYYSVCCLNPINVYWKVGRFD